MTPYSFDRSECVTTADNRIKVFALEHAIFNTEGHTKELPVFHHFAPGVYSRELRIPADTAAVGKIHKFPHTFILAQGEMSVTTGDEVVHIRAPYIAVSPAGTKRAVYAHTDCTVITIHQTHETDVAKIEDHFIAQNETEYAKFCGQEIIKCLG